MNRPIYRKSLATVASCLIGALPTPVLAQQPPAFTSFSPNNLVLSRSVYTGTASSVTVGQALPPNCPSTAACGTGKATDSGAFPVVGSTNNVFNNDIPDASFGITSPVFLDQLALSGMLVNSLAIPATTVSTSFSSKSELAVNLSADGTALTFMAYAAPPNTIDVSNSNTPVVNDPTNPVGSSYYRDVVQVSASGTIQATPTNAYSGNNGRAAVLANGLYYMVGNNNNGAGTPANIVSSTGVEIATPGQANTTVPQEIGAFSIAQLTNPATGAPYAADKAGKDNNFRGLTLFNNTIYVTKGSGSNGVNTVYQVGTQGTLPNLTTAAATPITILPGFPTGLAKSADAQNPFGLFFANANTLYVSDEGDGTAATLVTSPNAGIQKWILTNGTWQRAYVLQNGLNLGLKYGVANYPTALNPATDGVRNITGRVNGDGTVTLWGVTSTVSSNGDQGADPNQLVTITDVLANTSAVIAGGEQFSVVRSAGYAEVLRGVSLTPGTTPATTNPNALVVLSAAGTSLLGPGSLATAFGSGTLSIVDSTGKSVAITALATLPGQVNFQVPQGLAAGAAQVTLTAADGTKSTATVQIAATAPAVFALNGGGIAAADVYRVSGGLQTLEQAYAYNAFGFLVFNPIKNIATDQVYLVLFGTGIRGAAAGTVKVTANGVNVPVFYAGAQGTYPGLDQVNMQLPASLAGGGSVTLQLTANGIAANPVHVLIQ